MVVEKMGWVLSSIFPLAGLLFIPAAMASESSQTLRQENGLLTYEPPAWFLEGHFVAREKDPGFIFGPVRDFVKTLGGTTTWLIEDQELKRLDQATAEGKAPEYSLVSGGGLA